MPSIMLRGPFPLTRQSIITTVPEDCVGVYAFGEWTPLGGMAVRRIGRTTNTMREDLSACLGTYSLFQFRCCDTPAELFACECELYHNFMPRENNGHPVAPDGLSTPCPICGYQGS